jgi:hypothetical protein
MQTDRRPLTVQQKASLSRAGISLDVIHTLTRGTAAALIATALAPSARPTSKKSRRVEEEAETDDDDCEEEESEEDGELDPNSDDRGDPDDHDRKPPKRTKTKRARIPLPAPAALSDATRAKRALARQLDAMNGAPTTVALADDPIDLPNETIQLGEKPYESLRETAPDLYAQVKQGLDPQLAYTIALERR